MAKLGDVCQKKIDTIKSTYKGDINYIDISSVDNQRKEIKRKSCHLRTHQVEQNNWYFREIFLFRRFVQT